MLTTGGELPASRGVGGRDDECVGKVLVLTDGKKQREKPEVVFWGEALRGTLPV